MFSEKILQEDLSEHAQILLEVEVKKYQMLNFTKIKLNLKIKIEIKMYLKRN